MAPTLLFSLLQDERDIERVIALETASYPSDEAATPANIRFRQQNAGAFFYVARLAADPSTVVGFVNSTLTTKGELTGVSMSEHEPNGTTLCIHSVVTDPSLRRQGIASAMLKEYVRLMIQHHAQVQTLALIAKPYLVGFYVGCGFRATRLSPVTHGKDQWIELVLDADAARQLAVVQVDSFSAAIFDGNPAAVVVMTQEQYHKEGVATWMLNVAKENNLSETAYVAPRPSTTPNVAEYDLRWFTPGTEVSLCGHATLASAKVLFADGYVPADATIHFHTLSGVLVCTLEQSSGKSWIVMDFPLRPLEPASPDISLHDLATGLNLTTADLLTIKQTQTTDILVHIKTERFAAVVPNLDLLATINARGIVVTAETEPTDQGVDFQSRFFGPRVGVPEDPVTGSAHCALAGYWSELLHKTTLYAHQACPLRGGYINIELPQDRKDRVYLKGEAVVSLRGTLLTKP